MESMLATRYKNFSDQQLVDMIKEGIEEAAFYLIYFKYKPTIMAQTSILKPYDDVEDYFFPFFEHLKKEEGGKKWHRLYTISNSENISAWMKTTYSNFLMDILRGEKTERKKFDQYVQDYTYKNILGQLIDEDDPTEAIDVELEYIKLIEVINALPEAWNRYLLLTGILARKFNKKESKIFEDETADFGITAGAIRTAKSRAKEHLMKRVKNG